MQRIVVRYAFAVAMVLAGVALRKLLEPVTGTDAPIFVFFAAVVVTSLWAGPGPGICATLLSLPLAAYGFVMRAGYTHSQALAQAGLFTLDGLIVVYLSFRMTRTRRAAERSEARHRALIELAPDAFFLADLDGRYIDVNHSACRLLGYQREELIGKTIVDLIRIEDVPRLAAVRNALLQPGQVDMGEWQLKRKDGTLCPTEVSANILPGGLWQAFVRDISERKRVADEREELLAREQQARRQAERAAADLRESEERFRLTIDNAPIGMALLHMDGHFNRVNAALCEILGYTVEELQGGMSYRDITLPEDRQSDLALLGRLVRGEISRFQLEKRYIRKDRSVVSGLLSASLMRSPEGVPLYGIAQIEDITDRKRIEGEQRFLAEAGAVLATSLDYEQTLATLGQLVVRDFADWCVIDVIDEDSRPRRLKVVNAHPDDAPLAARLEQVQIERNLPHLAGPVLETGQAFVVEQVSSATQEWFAQGDEHLQVLREVDPRSILGLPMMMHGRLLGVLVLMASHRPRTYGPADMRLGEALAERAALAIENGRLYQAALRATQFRDEVLGIVAHDLRTPVAALMLQAEALQRRAPEPERRDQKPIQKLLRIATRMNRLIGDLLDVTLIEAGQLRIERTLLATRDLVGDSVDAQRPLAASAQLELSLELADDLPDLWGDQSRLTQVLENLVGNAIKFTAAGGQIRVGAARREGEVLFWVADNGNGIPAEGIPHVFDRFWQAKKSDRHGAGLGLPIARGIIEEHGGRIWVESTLGRGTVFFFTVPEAPPVEARPADTIH